MKADDRIREFVTKYSHELVLAALFALSVLIRIDLAPKTDWSGDYQYCIAPWVEEYRRLGVVQGLASSFTNYYIPYNLIFVFASLFPMDAWVIISILSCAGEYACVYYAYRILRYLGGEDHAHRSIYAAVLLLFLPPMILNSAFWKQCDAIYSAFALMAFYYLLKDSYYRAFVFLSVAFVFKLQTILLFPVFLIAYFCGKKYSLLMWLRIPVTYLEAGLPAILCGRPARSVYMIYFDQSSEYHYMFLNTGNLYRLFRSDYEAAGHLAVYGTVAFLALLTGYLIRHREAVNGECLLQLAGVTGYGCFMTLPAMHERYDYLPILLVTLYYAYYHRSKCYIPAMMILVTTVMYCQYLFGGNTLPEEAYALIALVAWFLALRDLIDGIQKREVCNVHKDQ